MINQNQHKILIDDNYLQDKEIRLALRKISSALECQCLKTSKCYHNFIEYYQMENCCKYCFLSNAWNHLKRDIQIINREYFPNLYPIFFNDKIALHYKTIFDVYKDFKLPLPKLKFLKYELYNAIDTNLLNSNKQYRAFINEFYMILKKHFTGLYNYENRKIS